MGKISLKKFWAGIKSKFNFSIFKAKKRGIVVPKEKYDLAMAVLKKEKINAQDASRAVYFHLPSAIMGGMILVAFILFGYILSTI